MPHSLQPVPEPAQVLRLLESHWDEEHGYCRPNTAIYPHLWLWDSCFHAIVWAHLGDRRALRELDALLAGQLAGGMLPHMRYLGRRPDAWLGPLPHTSSLTQPPMFGHAIAVLSAHGTPPGDEAVTRARRGLDWLWDHRRTDSDLIYVVHPWEAGNDHSPRWDDWGAPGRTAADYDRAARSSWNKARMPAIEFGPDGAAVWSSEFVACPAGFNALVAFNLAELGAVLDDRVLTQRANRISAAMDEQLWDPGSGLWVDLPLVGGGCSVSTPISDGMLGALVTPDEGKAARALDQLDDPDRFAAPFGPTNVARLHPAYDPAMYWRGVAWPPLNYLLWLALRRWERFDAAGEMALRTRRAAVTSGWAEYWNPETGQGLGAVPQSWAGLACAMEGQ